MQRATIRPATEVDIPSIARVHVDSWRSTYSGIVPAAVLDALSYQEHETRWRAIFDGHGSERHSQPNVFVAEDAVEKRTVGFASGADNSEPHTFPGYQGELHVIYILQHHQGNGVGRALFNAVADALAQQGMSSMVVWVYSENRVARRFYENLGGKLLMEEDTEIGGREISERAYGFEL